MNKGDLIYKICRKHMITKKEADSIINSILELIIESVSIGEKATLVGFGSFSFREKKERTYRNPKTGEKILVPTSRVPIFSAGKFFKKKVNQ